MALLEEEEEEFTMNFFEQLTLPFYWRDRNRGNSHNLSVFHCRCVITVILTLSFFDVYQVCCFVSKKSIFIFGRFLFNKNTDLYVLAVMFFFTAVNTTTSKKWGTAYETGETQRFDILSSFFFLLLPAIILVILSETIKWNRRTCWCGNLCRPKD